MNNGMYNDRNLINVTHQLQQGIQSNSVTEDAQLNQAHWNEEYFTQQGNPYCIAPPVAPFYCSQPNEQVSNAWAWSNEPNNNPSNLSTRNTQADPWNWSVNPGIESDQWTQNQQLSTQPNSSLCYPQSTWTYEQPATSYYQGDWPSWQQPQVVPPECAIRNNLNHNDNSDSLCPSESEQVPDILNTPVETQIDEIVDKESATPNLEKNLNVTDCIASSGSQLCTELSAEGQVDEPNQEVIEPFGIMQRSSSHESQYSPIHNHPEVIKETPNEQVPTIQATVHLERPPIREGSPFQSTRLVDVVQQELPSEIDIITSNLKSLDVKGQDCLANLELEPENLEHPPDTEANRPNPHHLALHRQHFSQELSSAKTLLWEQPDVPNVLFVPPDSSMKIQNQSAQLIEPMEEITVLPKEINNTEVSPTCNSVLECSTTKLQSEIKTHPITSNEEKASMRSAPCESNEAEKCAASILFDDVLMVENKFETDKRELRDTDKSSTEIPGANDSLYNSDYKGHVKKISSSTQSVHDESDSERITYGSSSTTTSRDVNKTEPRLAYSSQDNEALQDWNDALFRTTQPQRYKEMEDIDHRKYDRHSSSRYHRDRNDRYYYEESRERNSRPSSRASEPIPDNYSGRYYNQYPPEKCQDGYYDQDLPSLLLPRDGTPDAAKYRKDSKEFLTRQRSKPYSSQRRRQEEYDSAAVADFDRCRSEDNVPFGHNLDDIERRKPNDHNLERRSDYRVGRPNDVGRRLDEYSLQRRSGERSDSFDDPRQFSKGKEEEYYIRNSRKAYKPSYSDYYHQQDAYSSYYNYYNYPMNYNYGFYDELYRNNPKYREQMEQYRAAYYTQLGYDSDHLSVHSGRSSVNEELQKDRTDYENSSEYSGYQHSLNYETSSLHALDGSAQESTERTRLTPAKFSCSHPVGRLCPGMLLALLPVTSNLNTCSLELHDLQQSYSFDKEYKDAKAFPGPLLNGSTHKNDVIQFCQSKIQRLQSDAYITDRESQILLWELLVLMLRQNGNVSGSDIAELLLKDRQPKTFSLGKTVVRQVSTAGSSTSPNDDVLESHILSSTTAENSNLSPDEGIVVSQELRIFGGNSTSSTSQKDLSMEEITYKFTEYLLFGHKKDALEWATKHGLWGHALFLASKMDSRSYANIMTRFANSLPLNDPLQTLYQLMSGRQPSAVTRVAEEKWGDWRPHLAMILSNLTQQPEVDRRSITQLGDTLVQKGCLSAAHFCYLMAQVEFGKYENKACKLVLLTSNHTLPYLEFSSNEAIQCTEIYEYAQSLADPNFFLPNLQPYKLQYAARLVDYGLLQEAVHYCEVMTNLAVKSPGAFSTSLLNRIYQFSSRLKYHDPRYTQEQGELEDISDPLWLASLEKLVVCGTFPSSQETIPYEALSTIAPYSSESDGWHTNSENAGCTLQNSYGWQLDQLSSGYGNLDQSNWAPPSGATNLYSSTYGQADLKELPQESTSPQVEDLSTSQPTFQSPSTATKSAFSYYEVTTQAQAPTSNRERQNSVASGGRRDSTFSTSSINSQVQAPQSSYSKLENEKTTATKKEAKTKPQAGRSWLGGIFSKLLPKGPNQMILPDDKNPSIVWDPKTNKWVNSDDDDGTSTDVAPVAPPKDSDLLGNRATMDTTSSVTSVTNSVSSLASQPPSGTINPFQKHKQKSKIQNYVDVFKNTTGKISSINALPADNLFPRIESLPAPSLFVPEPSLDGPGDFVSHPVQQQNTMGTSEMDNSLRMFDPSEFSTAPKIIGDGKRTLGGYLPRRTYPS